MTQNRKTSSLNASYKEAVPNDVEPPVEVDPLDRVRDRHGDGAGVEPIIVDPDAELIFQIANGEPQAIVKIVDKYLSRITAHAFRLLGNSEDAEEVAQEVFLRIWKQVQKWEYGQAKFGTWIYRVTINLCFDRNRKHREVVMAEPPDMLDERPIASDVLEAGEKTKVVQLALETLPDRQRAALSLCYFDDLSNKEAAAILDISVDALESLLARGRRGLKKILADQRDELIGG